jgi:hypothetical protein
LNSGITLAPAGTFLIQSGGSFIDYNSSTTLNAEVWRVMSGNWTSGNAVPSTIWHAVSAPVLNPSNSLFIGSLMNQWNEPSQFWTPLTVPYVNMPVGKGYIVAPKINLPFNGITAVFKGTLNTGNTTIGSLSKTGATTWSGFNLIGNPFASAMQWNTNISLTNMTDFAWFWNGGSYVSHARADNFTIPAENGFFVQVLAAGTGSVTIPNTNRLHSADPFLKSEVADKLTLKVEGNGYWDETQVRILPGSSEVYNIEVDALKFPGSEIAPQLFSYKQDIQVSINSLPSLTVYPVVPLGLQPGASGNFTITASDVESFSSTTEFYLEDLVANKVQDLKSNPVYNFDAAPGQPEHRFNLHFASVGIKDNKIKSDIKVYSSEKTIYVNIPSDMRGNIVVYNMLGSEITRTAIQPNSLNKINLNVPSGFYLVKVDGDTNATTGKVFIR